MCGIVTVFSSKRNVDVNYVIELYLRQRNRGIQGYGFSYLTKKGVIRTLRFEHEAECFAALGRVHSRLIQLHHRHPTSTLNKASQNHPINAETKKYFYSFIHNGIIHDCDKLKEEHEAEGRIYSTWSKERKDFNDSETLMHEVIKRVETGKDYKIKSTGGLAFVMLQCDKNRRLQRVFFGRNWNPLFWITMKEKGVSYFSSEVETSMNAAGISPQHLYVMDWPSQKTAKVRCEFPEFRAATTPAPYYGHGSRKNRTNRGSTFSGIHRDDLGDHGRGENGYWDGYGSGYHPINSRDDIDAALALAEEDNGGVIDLDPEAPIVRPTTKEEKKVWQEMLMDVYRFGKGVLKDCFADKRTPDEMGQQNVVLHLRMIDAAVADLNMFDTAKAEGLRKQLLLERERLVPSQVAIDVKNADRPGGVKNFTETFRKIFGGAAIPPEGAQTLPVALLAAPQHLPLKSQFNFHETIRGLSPATRGTLSGGRSL